VDHSNAILVVHKIELPSDIVAPATQIEHVAEVETGAEMLHVEKQRDAIGVWFKCELGARKEQRKFTVVGTGFPVPLGQYIGTVVMQNGERVGHVFIA
jgi:hypothetical protein